MMNLIQRFFNQDLKNRNEIRKNFQTYFFSLPEHRWIDGECKEHFIKLFSLLPSALLDTLMTKYPLNFIRSEDLRPHNRPGMVLANTVVIFPEFQKLITSNKRSAVAYLAHELAFVLYELEEGQSDHLMAEVEADKFVCDLGLTFELEEFLLMLDETLEKRLRLTYLTINHFASGNN